VIVARGLFIPWLDGTTGEQEREWALKEKQKYPWMDET